MQTIKESVTDTYSHQGILWRFIPPGAPHMGGLWEAGVKSFKALFYKSTSSRKYTFEELSTLLAKVEACLSSRPLSPMSENPSELLALTPGHFLIGGPLLSTAEPEIKGEAKSIINRWQHLKALHQQFSARWKEEYLKELHKRIKWQNPSRDIQVDDMVVVKEDNMPSNDWRLGRVVSVFPEADSRVRVVEILTARGTIARPIHMLVLPPMEAKATSALPQQCHLSSCFKIRSQLILNALIFFIKALKPWLHVLLRLSTVEPLRAVIINKYCADCLAHQHSEGVCRSGDTCKKCGQDHHTLLHLHESSSS